MASNLMKIEFEQRVSKKKFKKQGIQWKWKKIPSSGVIDHV